MSQDLQISQKVIDTYDQALRPIAEKLSFELPVQAREPAGFPSVLCLGNHSSGKSSFINHLLGEDIQKTGLAPTDDGFTIITHGSQRESLDGHTNQSSVPPLEKPRTLGARLSESTQTQNHPQSAAHILRLD